MSGERSIGDNVDLGYLGPQRRKRDALYCGSVCCDGQHTVEDVEVMDRHGCSRRVQMPITLEPRPVSVDLDLAAVRLAWADVKFLDSSSQQFVMELVEALIKQNDLLVAENARLKTRRKRRK